MSPAVASESLIAQQLKVACHPARSSPCVESKRDSEAKIISCPPGLGLVVTAEVVQDVPVEVSGFPEVPEVQRFVFVIVELRDLF